MEVGLISKQPWQPRFTLTGILLGMLIACIMAAAASYLIHGNRDGITFGGMKPQAFFIIFTLIAPVLLLAIITGVRLALSLINRIGRGKR